MFAGEGTPLGASSAGRGPADASPLLILTDDRHYTIASACGSESAERVEEVATEPTTGGAILLPANRLIFCDVHSRAVSCRTIDGNILHLIGAHIQRPMLAYVGGLACMSLQGCDWCCALCSRAFKKCGRV